MVQEEKYDNGTDHDHGNKQIGMKYAKQKTKTQPRRKYHIASPEKGKSWSYEYGKLYPGRYNTPPLREDLVPRSRMAPEEQRKGKRRGKTKLLLRPMSETTNHERLNKLKETKQWR